LIIVINLLFFIIFLVLRKTKNSLFFKTIYLIF